MESTQVESLAGGVRTDVTSALRASKLVPPVARRGNVPRSGALVRRLAGGSPPPIVSVVAPAGYGKSTLLRQCTGYGARPSAWLTLDAGDNDPVTLLTYLAAALDEVVPVDPELFRRLAVEQPSPTVIASSLLGAAIGTHEPLTLVLDDVHVLQNTACHAIVRTLAEHTSDGFQVAAASRRTLPLPVQRLRTEGRLVEIGPADLALDAHEAAALLEDAGVELPESQVRELMAVTEGWAAPIALAARSIKANGGRAPADFTELGGHRYVAAYMQAELLSAQSDDTITFLTRTSVLGELSGELCDAALMTTGSAVRLEGLLHANLPVIPLDEHRRWYRYNHLFRGFLRAELAIREPDLPPELRRRAGRWCVDNGRHDAAIDHAMAAGDDERVAQLVLGHALPSFQMGDLADLRRWFSWFDDRGTMQDLPGVAAVGAWLWALTGRAATADRWADVADRAPDAGMLPDGCTPIAGVHAALRAGLCRDGVEQMVIDATAAERLIPPASAWRALALVILGIAHILAGDLELADEGLTHAVEVANDGGARPAASVALAERARLAFGAGRHDEAQALAASAADAVDGRGLRDQPTSAFVFAVGAHIAIRRGDAVQAGTLLANALRLRPRLTYAMPSLAVQARLELIRTLLAVGDASGARTMLREIDDVLRLRPRLGTLRVETEVVREQIARIPVGAVGASSLTTAELRLLPFLQTHSTFREIGERLHVSPHTVKTQAISIYRKLGVSSRSDAVHEAVRIGLLDN